MPLWEDAFAPYVGMDDDLQSEARLRRSLTLQEQMGRGEAADPALPSWLPPEVQRYMRATPDYAEGQLMAPSQWYNPRMDPRDSMRPGDASNGLSRAWAYRQGQDAAGWPRDEGNTGLQYGWNPYAGGGPGDEGGRGYPQMRDDGSSLLDMIRRVLAGGRQST
jgi:hypothetical protein